MGLSDIERAALTGAGYPDGGGIAWRPLYTVADAAEVVGTRTRLYNELSAGRLSAVRVGRRTMVTGDSLRRWCETLEPVQFGKRRRARAAQHESATL